MTNLARHLTLPLIVAVAACSSPDAPVDATNASGERCLTKPGEVLTLADNVSPTYFVVDEGYVYYAEATNASATASVVSRVRRVAGPGAGTDAI